MTELPSNITTVETHGYNNTNSSRVFVADVKYSNDVLSWISDDLQKKKIPLRKQNNIIIATEEIFSNIAQYAYQKTGHIWIKIYNRNGYYNIRFSDRGIPYNPLKKEQPDLSSPIEKREIGGLGIFLIKKMADKVSYKHLKNQNILTVSFLI